MFHVVYEKADVERIPPDTAAYKVVEDIRDYSQLGGLKRARQAATVDLYVQYAYGKQTASNHGLIPFTEHGDK